jgi:hypothetical protein
MIGRNENASLTICDDFRERCDAGGDDGAPRRHSLECGKSETLTQCRKRRKGKDVAGGHETLDVRHEAQHANATSVESLRNLCELAPKWSVSSDEEAKSGDVRARAHEGSKQEVMAFARDEPRGDPYGDVVVPQTETCARTSTLLGRQLPLARIDSIGDDADSLGWAEA